MKEGSLFILFVSMRSTKLGRGNTWANDVGHTCLSMKEGSLFVLFVSMRSTKLGCGNTWAHA
jgi:hypothetical protein